jgi:Tfp pilus assembly protein PilO
MDILVLIIFVVLLIILCGFVRLIMSKQKNVEVYKEMSEKDNNKLDITLNKENSNKQLF